MTIGNILPIIIILFVTIIVITLTNINSNKNTREMLSCIRINICYLSKSTCLMFRFVTSNNNNSKSNTT